MFRSSTRQDVQSTDKAEAKRAQVSARLAQKLAQKQAQIAGIQARQAAAQLSAMAAERARQASAQVGPLAQSAMNQVGPLAESAQVTARRGLYRARVWAAPQLERGAVVVQDNLAPKVSDVLIATARRVDPDQKRRRWPGIVAGVAVFAAGAAAAVVVIRSKRQAALAARPSTDLDAPDEAGADSAEARETSDTADAQAEANGRVRTP